MEMYNAEITEDGENKFLTLELPDNELHIPLTEDEEQKIKEIFNILIKELKKGEFNFQFEQTRNNLYQNISAEYISHLNIELSAVYNELNDFGLLD
ncbi:hypothetical protein [Spirochaeta cellobiosiphila]|uniref:hypothetical protein n=1 Tax=Spirochaeta cellobiosiphila TaxID=504483 RepID=UPI000403E017|nr:hypothetical protein [Spirochaeta cellobiosiphila]